MTPKNPTLALKHKADFRARRKAGLVAIDKPWDWLSAAEVKQIALKAYHVASHGLVEDLQDDRFSVQELREVFAANLADLLRDLVMAQAVTRGGCWPVGPETPAYANYPRIADALCADLPESWRPQYPLFMPQQVVQS